MKRAAIVACALSLLAQSCGYTLQTSASPLAERGIKKVYISPLVNNTYKIGVENLLYNALVRKIAAHRRVELVQNQKEADAVLTGKIANASYTALVNTAIEGRTLASQYQAALSVDFNLSRRVPVQGLNSVLWTGSFSRTQPFASSVQSGVRGETTALINESEFDRTLTALVQGMMSEVHESMMAMF